MNHYTRGQLNIYLKSIYYFTIKNLERLPPLFLKGSRTRINQPASFIKLIHSIPFHITQAATPFHDISHFPNVTFPNLIISTISKVITRVTTNVSYPLSQNNHFAISKENNSASSFFSLAIAQLNYGI